MSTATILVVDDEELIRWSLREGLRNEGYEIFEAGTGAEAIEQFKRGVDLVNLTGESLSSIGKRVGSINENIASLTRSAQEQASGIGEINSAVRSMDQITQQNAALMEEANASVQSLSAISGRLAALIGRFRIAGSQQNATPASRMKKTAA